MENNSFTYDYLNPSTMDPDPNGKLYRITQIGPATIYEAVAGHLDSVTGEFIPDPIPAQQVMPSDTDILGQQLVEMELRLLALEGGAGS